MYIGTTEAASLLEISPSRMRQLQKEELDGRIKLVNFGSFLFMTVCLMLRKPNEDRRELGTR